MRSLYQKVPHWLQPLCSHFCPQLALQFALTFSLCKVSIHSSLINCCVFHCIFFDSQWVLLIVTLQGWWGREAGEGKERGRERKCVLREQPVGSRGHHKAQIKRGEGGGACGTCQGGGGASPPTTPGALLSALVSDTSSGLFILVICSDIPPLANGLSIPRPLWLPALWPVSFLHTLQPPEHRSATAGFVPQTCTGPVVSWSSVSSNSLPDPQTHNPSS